MSNLKEYIITLKNFDDLEDFYNDMENITTNKFVPNRKVKVAKRRLISKNTHYFLNEEEVKNIINDPRIENIELNYTDANINITPSATSFSVTNEYSTQFNKNPNASQNDINWGLLASNNTSQPSDWGSDSTASLEGSFLFTSTGRNVDVVIVDGALVTGHPEFDSYDTPSKSRYIKEDWYKYNLELSINGFSGNYPYLTFENSTDDINNDHGTHSAGVSCGFLQGWAKNANIYNINPYDTNSLFTPHYIIDWIRAFHKDKLVNPTTGLKNPTIVNMSFNLTKTIPVDSITSIIYRSINHSKPSGGWGSTLVNYGIPDIAYTDNTNTNININVRSLSLDVDIGAAINEGIIFVGSAGNLNTFIDISGGNDYLNNLVYNGTNYYYHQGSSPGAAASVICVGAVDDTKQPIKTIFSNNGPRVDIFAPGASIMGPIKTSLRGTTYTQRSTSSLDLYAYSNNADLNSSFLYNENYLSKSVAVYGSGFIRPLINPNGMIGTYYRPIFVFNQNDKATTIADNYINCIVPASVYQPGTNCVLKLKAIIASSTASWGNAGSFNKQINTYIAISWLPWSSSIGLNPTGIGYTFITNTFNLSTLNPNTWTDIEIPIPDSVVQSNLINSNVSFFYIRISQFLGNTSQLWAIDYTAYVEYDESSITPSITDERKNSFFVNKLSGTSSAAAQVTGVIASSAEVLNHINQQEARNILNKFSKSDILYNPSFDNYNNVATLHGANNKYLYRRLERQLNGQVFPKVDYDPSYNYSRVGFPRPLIRRIG